MVREKYQGKVREFCGCQGKFRKNLNWKVREKSGNLKINGYNADSLQKIHLFCSRGEKMYILMR